MCCNVIVCWKNRRRTRRGVKTTRKTDASYRFYTLRIASFFSKAFRRKFFFLDVESRFCSHFHADNTPNIRLRISVNVTIGSLEFQNRKFDDFIIMNK